MVQSGRCQSSGVALLYLSPEQGTFTIPQKDAVSTEETGLVRIQCKVPAAKICNCYKGKD